MKRLVTIILLLSGMPLIAQTDRIDSLLNDLIYNDSDLLIGSEKPLKFDFVNIGANFNSNSYYAGREIGSDMYNIAGHLYYYSSTGLFFGASGTWFDQLTPGYCNTTLSAGFSKAIGQKKLFTFRTAYSRFIYNKPDAISEYPYTNSISLGLSFRKKWIGARFSPNLLFGEEYRINTSTGLYTRFTLIKFGKYNKIYTGPELTAFFGTETVETIKGGHDNSQSTSDLKDVNTLMNTQLYLPLGISLGDFDLEAGFSVNFPTTKDANITYPATTMFSVAIGYLLPIVKK